MSQVAAVQTVEHPDWSYFVCVLCLKRLGGEMTERIKIIEVLHLFQVITRPILVLLNSKA